MAGREHSKRSRSAWATCVVRRAGVFAWDNSQHLTNAADGKFQTSREGCACAEEIGMTVTHLRYDSFSVNAPVEIPPSVAILRWPALRSDEVPYVCQGEVAACLGSATRL